MDLLDEILLRLKQVQQSNTEILQKLNQTPGEAIRIPVTTKALKPLGVGPTMVKKAIANGELTAGKGSRQRVTVDKLQLLNWINRNSGPVVEESAVQLLKRSGKVQLRH